MFLAYILFLPFKMNEKQTRYQQVLEAKQTASLEKIKERENEVPYNKFTPNAFMFISWLIMQDDYQNARMD